MKLAPFESLTRTDVKSPSGRGPRRAAAKTSAFAVAAALALSLAPMTSCRKDRPFDHVVLVTIDTLRADHLGAYGYPRPVSPFIDWLAHRGVWFERAISTSSHTGPSHASLFTSQFPARHHVVANGMPLNESLPTLASTLASAGFETTAITAAPFLRSVTTGFETVRHKFPATRPSWKADHVVDETVDWLSQRDDDRPFFLWVHFFDVHNSHYPEDAPPEIYQRAVRKQWREQPELLQEVWSDRHNLPAEVVAAPDLINTYDAQLAFVDAELRRLHDAIESETRGSRVLWVVTADHGEGLGNHGTVGHGVHLYQEQVRVPLVFYGDRAWNGERVRELVRHVDLYPTVLELAGVPDHSEDIEGTSLGPLLRGREQAWEETAAFSQRRTAGEMRLERGWTPGLVIAAQDGRYKYILKTEAADELYDLRNDEDETKNLLLDGEAPPDSHALVALLKAYIEALASSDQPGMSGVAPEYVDELRALGYLP